jgi:DNA-binding response OmpR family regulator
MTELTSEPLRYVHGTITLDRLTRKVSAGSAQLDLSPREYSFLELLLAHRGQVVTRDRIAAAVWETTARPETNLIDVYVLRLRKKLAATGHATARIRTIRRIGYMLE